MMYLGIIQKLLKSPMALFVYGILSKWYLMIAVASMIVVFWVFKGLNDAGVLKHVEETVLEAFSQSKAVAKYCVPKIMNLSSFWDCLDNPPIYNEQEELEALKQMNYGPAIDPDIYSSRDPYDEDYSPK